MSLLHRMRHSLGNDRLLSFDAGTRDVIGLMTFWDREVRGVCVAWWSPGSAWSLRTGSAVKRSARRSSRGGRASSPIESFDTAGPGDQDRRRGQELRRDALPGRAQEERQADEPGGRVRGRGGGAGGRGFGARHRPSSTRRGSASAWGRGSPRWTSAELVGPIARGDRPRRRASTWASSPGAGRVDVPALAAEAPAEHGRRAHLDPPPRDGAEQHDRDRLRRGDSGGRRGVPPDRPRRRRRDAGRRLRQPARPAHAGRLPAR